MSAKNGKHAPKSPEWMHVTPKMAESWLHERADNRGISITNVEGLCRAIRAGEFRSTHQGIAFRKSDGKLIDGQHRLSAIVQTGVGISMWVFSEVSDESITVMDTGKARTVGAILEIGHGISEGAKVKALVTMLHYIHTGAYATLTATEVLAVHSLAPDLFAWNEQFNHRDGFGTAPVAAACMFASVTAPEKIQAFRESLHEGANLPAGSPILLLRNIISKRNMLSWSGRTELLRLALTAASKYLGGSLASLLRPQEIETLRATFMPAWVDKFGAWPIRTATVDRTVLLEKIARTEPTAT